MVLGDAGPLLSYERLIFAYRQIEAGAPLLALAANRVFKDADGALSLDAGAFVHALEYASGTEAIVLGKPSPDFFLGAVARLGCAPSEVAMVGDDAESDVSGALRMGIGTAILVQTGKYRARDEFRFDPRPTILVESLSGAVDQIFDQLDV